MEIHWVHAEEIAPEERSAAEEQLRALAADHTDLIDLRITARPVGHQRQAGQEVRLTCQARGRELVVARTRRELDLALREVLDAFEIEVRRMRDRWRERRGHQPATPPMLGIVDRVFARDGYGFILTDDGERVYFHRNAVHGGLDFDSLDEGQRVGLNLEAGNEGLQATTVVAPPPDTPSP